jgi:hypothetical protein
VDEHRILTLKESSCDASYSRSKKKQRRETGASVTTLLDEE